MRSRTLLILLLSVCLLAPVVANPNGPPWINPINGGLTVETGCTCHGDGVPSNDVVVSISGVPRAYSLGESYEFTINLQHASYSNGGFLLSDYGSGTFTAGETIDDSASAESRIVDLVKASEADAFSGELLYIENTASINRPSDGSQTEDIKVIVQV